MRYISSIIGILLFQICVAQCPQIDKLGTGYYNLPKKVLGTEDFTTEWFYVNADTTQYCCDIKKVSKYTNTILLKVKEQIINRANEDFYNNLEFEHLIVYYYDTKSLENYDSVKFKLDEVGRINYKVSYKIKYLDKVKYRFELGLDNFGEIISEKMFPDLKRNPTALDIINPCQVIDLVENDIRFKGKVIKSVKLQFDQIENSFYWLVEEDGEKQIDFKKIKSEKWYEFVSLIFRVSQSAKITNVSEEKHRVVYCGF